MAQYKHSFIAYTDWHHIFDMLSDTEAGKLIKHTLAYVNDLHPVFEPADRLLAVAFEPIKQALKKDLVKYDAIRQKRADSGRVGGLSKKTKPTTVPKKEEAPAPSIPNSPFGDGILHYQCIQHAKSHPGKYSATLYQDFLTYWTAPLQKGRTKGRELWRDQKTWALEGRLATWSSKEPQTKIQNGKQSYLQSVGANLDQIIAAAN